MSSENVPKKKRGMALGLAALLFVTGVAAGVAVDRLVERDRGHSGEGRGWRGRSPEAKARRYRDRLDLDQAQTARVEAVLRRTWTATREVIGPMEPKIDAIRQRGGPRDPRAPAPRAGRALRPDGGRRAAAPGGDAQGARAARAAGPSLTEPRRRILASYVE